jgi:trans-2-enoyl-CoA reductase
MVTYGNMSKQPVNLPAGLLIFRNIWCTGFWMARWKDKHSGSVPGEAAYQEMVDSLSKLILDGELEPPPCDLIPFMPNDDADQTMDRFLEGLERSQQPFNGRKQVLVMDQSLIKP